MIQPLTAWRVTLLLAVCGVLPLGSWPQDPPRPQEPALRNPRPPADAMPLAPVPDGLRTAVERRDLASSFLPSTPLEGVWHLTRIALPGGDLGRIEGYLIAGRRHLVLHLLHGEPGGGKLFVQSGARQYQLQDSMLVTSALAGHDNLTDGTTLRFDTPGRVERRRIDFAGSRLIIHQDDHAFMEFVRVE